MTGPFTVRELVVSYHPRAVAGDPLPEQKIQTAADAARFAGALETSPGVTLDAEPVEVSVVLMLSTKHRVLAFHVVSRGSLDATVVHPREVFRAAIATAATSAIVLVHNHPSGDPTPSPDDVALTRRLADAGRIIGIDVLDHVIIGEAGRFASLRERGEL